MQIVYMGFAGSAAIEAEAGVQLLRLERFSGLLKSCHLAIESLHAAGQRQAYDVRLDLLSASDGLKPILHCTGEDPIAAMREAFDAAERELKVADATITFSEDGRTRRDH
ncbi:hypothetical protein [Paraburkholderia tagetis]|uniref:Metal ABC transporter ATPase n=1 Tax=Paraburkholderia tagetis TaxID=2913261 RepID=A0A9X1UHA1_9BURK|nr:hypothetical protein [Paraburkholderia tagetis]MCG5076270.1 hypothetical protein [Paraburkholderia tagetis]